jgi:hypothetical protein
MKIKITSNEATKRLIEECRYIQQLKRTKSQNINPLKLFDSYVLPYFQKELNDCAIEVKNKLENSSIDDEYVISLKKKYPLDTITDAFFIDAATNFTKNHIEQLYNWLLH